MIHNRYIMVDNKYQHFDFIWLLHMPYTHTVLYLILYFTMYYVIYVYRSSGVPPLKGAVAMCTCSPLVTTTARSRSGIRAVPLVWVSGVIIMTLFMCLCVCVYVGVVYTCVCTFSVCFNVVHA